MLYAWTTSSTEISCSNGETPKPPELSTGMRQTVTIGTIHGGLLKSKCLESGKLRLVQKISTQKLDPGKASKHLMRQIGSELRLVLLTLPRLTSWPLRQHTRSDKTSGIEKPMRFVVEICLLQTQNALELTLTEPHLLIKLLSSHSHVPLRQKIT